MTMLVKYYIYWQTGQKAHMQQFYLNLNHFFWIHYQIFASNICISSYLEHF